MDLFHKNPKHHKQGVIGGPYNVNIENKDSIDLEINNLLLLYSKYQSINQFL